mgnify:CR=1 FL=1
MIFLIRSHYRPVTAILRQVLLVVTLLFQTYFATLQAPIANLTDFDASCVLPSTAIQLQITPARYTHSLIELRYTG